MLLEVERLDEECDNLGQKGPHGFLSQNGSKTANAFSVEYDGLSFEILYHWRPF